MCRVSSPSHLAVALILRREADRAADLKDHLGDGGAQPVQHFVEHRGVSIPCRLAHGRDVQHGRPRVVAVDRLLDLVLHRDRNVVRSRGRKLGA